MAEPSLNSIFGNLDEWGTPNPPKSDKLYDQYSREVYEHFSSPAGQRIFELLCEMTLRRGFVDYDPITIAKRQGQNSVTLGLFRYYKNGKELVDDRRNSGSDRTEREPRTSSSGGFGAIK